MDNNFLMIPMFPVPLYTAFDLEISNEDKHYIFSTDYHLANSENGYISKNRQLLNDVNLTGLRDTIDEHVNNFVKEVFNPKDDVEFYMTSSWAMKHRHKDHANSHYHVNSIISGIVYLNVDDESGDLIFVNRNSTTHYPQLQIPSEKNTMYTNTREYVKPKNNQIVIFPSHISHAVNYNESSIERYCVAFNYFVRGRLGSEESELFIL